MHTVNSPYFPYRELLKEKYGTELQRVPIDLQQSCPHRDVDGTGGCTFCSEDGSKAVQTRGVSEIKDQVEKAIKFAQERYKAKEFMAYLQAFTATFSGPTVFRKHVEEILSLHSFKALSIGTRPDCLSKSTLEFLSGLNKEIDVWVELGIQSTHDVTLEHIQREHDWKCSEDAVYKLASYGLLPVAHVILGLPGETKEMMLQTAKTLGKLPLKGVKIHNLHVIKNTQLETEYYATPFKVLNEIDYIEICSEFLRLIPSSVPIMRLTADTLEDELVAPKWCLKKGQVMAELERRMNEKGVVQGDLVEEKSSCVNEVYNVYKEDRKDYFNKSYNEFYHSYHHLYKVVENASFEESHWLKSSQNMKVLECGFGKGILSYHLLQKLSQYAITIDSVDTQYSFLKQLINEGNVVDKVENKPYQTMLREISLNGVYKEGSSCLRFFCEDLRGFVKYSKYESYDLIFHDGFSEKNNSELYTTHFLYALLDKLKVGGVLCFNLLTKRSVELLKFMQCEIIIEKPNVIVKKLSSLNTSLLHKIEKESCYYHDPSLSLIHKEIVKRRDEGMQTKEKINA